MNETESRSLCSHCGLPLRPRRGSAGTGEPLFCCVGCRLAAAAAGSRDGRGGGLLEARLMVASFLAMGVMTFSLVLYGETVYAPVEDDALTALRNLGRTALALLSLPVFALLAVPLFSGAWLDLRAGAVRMDGLIVLAVTAAYGLSVHHTFAGVGEVYYDTATMVLVLVTFGRRLEAAARLHGRDAAETLAECLPESAHRLDAEGTALPVAPESLDPGDVVRVPPGEAAPADLVIREGRSEIRAAHLTGEERPHSVGPGDHVPAGAVNGNGALLATVERRAREGALGRIARLLDEPLPPTRTIRTTDRLASWLAAVAILLATAGGLRSYLLEGLGSALNTALSVLLVACPCALGLATPLAYRALRVGLGRQGILVRDPAALEVAATVDRVLVDKTGTLTDPRRARLVTAAATESVSRRLAVLVGHSGHALAGAVPAVGKAPADLRIVPGCGVEATLDGRPCRAGSPDWMDRESLPWEPDAALARDRLAAGGETLVAYAEEGRVQAVGSIAQPLRPGAAEAVARLQGLGVRVEVLSGDHPAAAARVANELGIEGTGGLDPDAKVARVRELRAAGQRVLVAGDGVNDAPALRAADVGVAMACGTAAARSQAQVEVLGGDLVALPRLVAASQALRAVVHGNLFWAVVYNSVALGLAAFGLLHPLVAVAAMIVSSLAVSARSYRLLGWEAPE